MQILWLEISNDSKECSNMYTVTEGVAGVQEGGGQKRPKTLHGLLPSSNSTAVDSDGILLR